VVNLLAIMRNWGYIEKDLYRGLYRDADEITKMLRGLIKK